MEYFFHKKGWGHTVFSLTSKNMEINRGELDKGGGGVRVPSPLAQLRKFIWFEYLRIEAKMPNAPHP